MNIRPPVAPLLAEILDDLAPHVATGRLVLFTGAGFGADARSIAGEALPTSRRLRELLWDVAFPGEELDDSQLDDLYECAVAADREQTGRVLTEHLTVDEASLPESYRVWFSVPWARAYTLNVDDLDEAVGRRWDVPAPIRSLSALHDGLPARTGALLSVHLNGRVADFPAMTFSQLEYGHRTAVPDPWYQHLAVDLRDGPVVFVGTSLDEPPLWQQVALHLVRAERDDDRSSSYLVTPRTTRAREDVLRRLNVTWVPMSGADFAAQVLCRLGDACADGHRALRTS